MEGGSEGEKKPPEGENKSKRKMKTASQLEMLEEAYAMETYPSEALRAELSAKLGLSDRQLQMWFCHRRLKDRKTPSVKRPRKFSSAVEACGEEMVVGNLGNEDVSGLGMGSDRFAYRMDARRVVQRPGVAIARIGVNIPSMKRFYESQQSIAELRAIAFVEAQLGESLRENGPILGMEFDPLPPGAFGAPIEAATISNEKLTGRLFEVNAYKHSDAEQIEHHQVSGRTLHEYKFLPEQPTVKIDRYERSAPSYHHFGFHANFPNVKTSLTYGHSFLHGNERVSSRYCSQGQMPDLNIFAQQSRQGHLSSSVPGEHGNSLCNNSLLKIALDPQCGAFPSQLEYTSMPSDLRVIHEKNVLCIQKKHKNDVARISREVDAHEKKIQKELEKQDVLRRKREEQIRKEMEKHERERRREEERLAREKQKEEERCRRQQRREMLRREKFLQKESIKAERIRQKEALRREREAARLKAANQRAIARRMAKESMELAEDERLELMELAVSSKGLPSIMSLDHEILQNLELFEDMRPTFPPRSVQMKRPFSNQPWIDSEENVWKFLVTFADVLGLWPFTLDEFVQAFHDYDPRLLGEVHVTLLRCILKDIENVARKPSMGLGVNQHSATYAGGGHPEIVEGAYVWGFDICSWQRHLNPLTWPEILRQFALSAGFGPQMVKGNAELAYLCDENEGNDVEGIVSNLRNGLAAEYAVAIMLERGFSNPRRSRHCLTPGTVKFAAFHVLSLEGSKGLTIVEVADKIQKSGLRDLRTSRTPEATIGAALSRDSKLFERTAPSTYCVRSPYRKDPADADVILSAARENICIFKRGCLDGEDAERDEDAEVDVTEAIEVDDLGIEANLKKEYEIFKECPFDEVASVANGKETDDVTHSPKVDMENVGPHFSTVDYESRVQADESPLSIDPSIFISGICSNLDLEDSISDEGDQGEPWVRGLTEGEYSDLSVEERLNALCSLIGVALEGNSIRTVLEERLEAANGLKKQMLAEAQLDKQRGREEYVTQMHGPSNVENKSERKVIPSTEGRQSSILNDGDRNSGPLDPSFQQEHCSNSRNNNYLLNDFPSEGNLQAEDIPVGAFNSQFQHSGLAAEMSRSEVKSYIGRKAEEMYVYRSLPLGQDRRRNRYWKFTSSASLNEPGHGRIFVELHNGSWRLVDSAEGFDALLASLDVRGIRESHLHTMLKKLEGSFKAAVQRNVPEYSRREGESYGKANVHESSSEPDYCVHINGPNNIVSADDSDVFECSTSFIVELGVDKTDSLKRYKDFESWMWRECSSPILSTEKYGKKRDIQLLNICNHCRYIYSLNSSHCCTCHQTYSNSDLNFPDHVAQCKENVNISCPSPPLRIRLLKVLLTSIEVSIPMEAFQPFWTDCYRKSWGSKLQSSSSAKDILQILTSLESGIKRDFLWSNYETTSELLACINLPGTSISHSSPPEIVPVLPWMPLTTAAVALRLLEFDTSISYILHQEAESQNQGSRDAQLLSNFAARKNHQDSETAIVSNECVQEANLSDRGFGFSSSECGQIERREVDGRIRGGRSKKKINGSRVASEKSFIVTNREISRQVLRWKGQAREQAEFRRGRRSVRSRQKSARKIKFGCEEEHPEEFINKKSSSENNQQWTGDQNTGVLEEGDASASSSGRLLFSDDNGGVEYDVVVDSGAHFQRRADYVQHGVSYNMDEDKDDDINASKERGNAIDEELGDVYVEGCTNEDSIEESKRKQRHNMISDEEVESASD